MAVERIEWQCPGCQRRFAIPNQEPRPQLCPDCKRNQAAARSPRAAEPELEFADGSPDIAAGLPHLSGQRQRTIKRQRYEILRPISLWLKVMAGLIGVSLLLPLYRLAKAIFDTPVEAGRMELVSLWITTLLGGITLVLAIYTFSVAVLVLKDIEYNTRQE